VARTGAVFLDRDGTVIVDREYLADPESVELLPGAAAAVARLNRAGRPVILVTNQSGIGRGYFSQADFRAVQDRFEALLAEAGAHLDAVYLCPHAPDAEPACDCRKPAPGLFLRAAAEHRLDLGTAFYVGDRVRDVAFGAQSGGTGILLPGREAGENAPPGVVRVESLAHAVDLVLGGHAAD
jgi:D-glycero-D-manno-heptose 1,7-bisphosphate phosphatase